MHYSQKKNRALYFFAALIAAAVCVLIFEYNGVGDSDYYWHIVLGREICQTHSIPTQDTFSWLSDSLGLQETAHSWLGSIILYKLSLINSNPMYGQLIFVFLSAFAYALFVDLAWGKELNDPFENCLFVCLVTALMTWGGRPMNIGILLFAISFYLLNDGYRNPESKKYRLLPVVAILWANIHGGSLPILFAFNTLFVAMSFLPDVNTFGLLNEREQPTARARKMGSLLVVNMLAGLLNPYGFKLYYYFFITNNEATKRYVSEWQPSALADPVVFFCIAFLFVIVASRTKIRLTEFLPILCCLLLTSRYVRIRSYLLVVMIPLIFRFLSVMMKEQENRMWKNGGRFTMGFTGKSKFWTIVTSAALVVACCIYAPFIATNPEKTGDKMDAEFVELLHALNPQRMYTSYNDGGYAIYHGFQSFCDSRADLFPEDALDASIQLAFSSGTTDTTYRDALSKWDFDAVLLSKESNAPAIEFMEVLPGWEKTIENDYYVIFTPQ